MPRVWPLLFTAPLWLGASAFPLETQSDPLLHALDWLGERTGPDGCIASEVGGACGHASTRDAVLAISSAGVDPHDWRTAGENPVEYLRANGDLAEQEATGCQACVWAKIVVALAAVGEDPRDFGGRDYVARLDEHFDGIQVGAPSQINDDAWALYAYAALDDPDEDRIQQIRFFVAARQNALDGGWSWNLAPESEAWGTATVILALLATGSSEDDSAMRDALTFLHTQQAESGLVVQDGSGSAESTALVAQVAWRVGEDPSGPVWTPSQTSLVAALLDLQSVDGSFVHNEDGGSEFLATTQVLPALRGVPYPFRPPRVAILASPASGTLDSTFSFQSIAEDADGRVASHRWRFDDGTTTEGSNAAHRFTASGVHDVWLEVEDDDGVARSRHAHVNVTPSPPPPTPSASDGPSRTLLFSDAEPRNATRGASPPASSFLAVAATLTLLTLVRRR